MEEEPTPLWSAWAAANAEQCRRLASMETFAFVDWLWGTGDPDVAETMVCYREQVEADIEAKERSERLGA